MAPYVHRVFSQQEYGTILEHFQDKVEELYALHGNTEEFRKNALFFSSFFGDVPGCEEWVVNFIQEKREEKERQEREERMAYAKMQPVVYQSQETIGLLEKIYELLKELVSGVSRFLPSPSPKSKTFRMLLQGTNHSDLLRRLHNRIDNKKGKDVAMVLLKAKAEKMISRLPTEAEFRSEFKLVCSWRSISTFLNPNVPVDITSVAI